MKKFILSADGDKSLYSVPDKVAEQLKRFCLEFDYWMMDTPEGQWYWNGQGYCYTEADFIDWLNEVRFPEETSRRIAVLGDFDSAIPEEYRDLPYFNF